MMTGNDDRNPDLSEEQDASRTGMDIQFIQLVFRNYPMNIQKKPDSYAYLFEKTDSPEVNSYMAGQQVDCRGKKYDILIFKFAIQRIRNPSDAPDKREKIIGYYSCSCHQSSQKNKYQLDFVMVKGYEQPRIVRAHGIVILPAKQTVKIRLKVEG